MKDMRCSMNKYFDRRIETKSAHIELYGTNQPKTTKILTRSSNVHTNRMDM